MRIGIISDTHDNVGAITEATHRFEQEGVDTVIHCGDYIAPLTVPHFDDFTLHGVLGNNDGEIRGLFAAFRSLGEESHLHGRFGSVTIDGTDIAMLHGENREAVEAIAASGMYDYVCCGHFHRRELSELKEGTIVNPGGHYPETGKGDRTVAVLDTGIDSVEFYSVI